MDAELSIKKALTSQQVVYAGVSSGILLFAAVTVMIGHSLPVRAELSRFLVPGLIAVALVAVIAGRVLHGVFLSRARQRVLDLPDDVDPVPAVAVYWQRSSLLIAAAADAVGVLACVAYLLTRATEALAVAGMAIAFLLARFPLRGRFDSFLIDAGVR